jgi:acetyltransferase-like isoleucine patch superfamily enzyme
MEVAIVTLGGKIVILLVGLLPSCGLKSRALALLGFEIAKTARISPSVLWDVQTLIMSEQARVGFGNVFRNVRRISIGESSKIGQWNWVSAAPTLVVASDSVGAGSLTVGSHSAITSRHYLDISGGIEVGEFTTIAGMRSTFITHGIDVAQGKQVATPISVGDYALVGSNVTVVPGANLPDHCLFAMGSVVIKGLSEPRGLYAGNPAQWRRTISGAYFNRKVGRVDPVAARK